MARLSSMHAQISAIIGNALEHYDTALFSLLAPSLAPIFFPSSDPLVSLILTYCLLPIGALARPLGSVCFGWIGDRFGRGHALYYSLFATGCTSVGIGFLPTYQEWGLAAPLCLCFGRILQSFFAAGETVGGALFVLTQTKYQKRGWISSLYDASSLGGILIASSLAALLDSRGSLASSWRMLFWSGGLTALLGAWLRKNGRCEEGLLTREPVEKGTLFSVLFQQRRALCVIAFAAGFSYTTYSLAFTLMNGYVPHVTTISASDMLQNNSWLLVADLLLLPCFGFLSGLLGKERVMLFGAAGFTLSVVPLFMLLDQASSATVVGVRLLLILFGTAFAAPYYAWALEQAPARHSGLVVAVGSSLGLQLIGSPVSAVCLWLYTLTGSSIAPGIYCAGIGGFAAATMLSVAKKGAAATNRSAPEKILI